MTAEAKESKLDALVDKILDRCKPGKCSCWPGCAEKGLRRELAEVVKEAVDAALNTPEMASFVQAVQIEAAHQKERWKATDPEKVDTDWFWLIGYLGGKAVGDPHHPDDPRNHWQRKAHRITTIAAAAYHWHSATLADAKTRGVNV